MKKILEAPDQPAFHRVPLSDIVEGLRAACGREGGADWSVDADIEWSETVQPPADAEAFAHETIFIICNSGMKFTIARQIFDRVMMALHNGLQASDAFGHPGKAEGIQKVWDGRRAYYAAFLEADDKLEFCASLPWVGKITKYHLAKNFGVDVCKPDVHLQRLSDHAGTDPHSLCAALAAESGYRIATVDVILWRACATGLIDSRTGAVRLPPAA